MTSPSTLSRKAAKSKNPKEAKKLRAIAAKLRREQRARDAKTIKPKMYPGTKEAIMRGQLDLTKPIANVPQTDGTAGWQPAPKFISPEVEKLRTMARSKDAGHFDHALHAMKATQFAEGRAAESKLATEQMKNIREVNRINVVCAFIAEMNGIMAINKGPLPPVVMVAGFTLARVLDALCDAGYTTEGKTGMQRRG